MEKDILTYHRYQDSHGRSWCGSQQKAISAKIDNSTMEMINSEVAVSGVTRNRLLNLSVKWYLTELDDARRRVASGSPGHKYTLNVDMSDLTTGELETLGGICHCMGCTMEVLVLNAVKVMVNDYNKNPMRWMP